MRIPSHAVEKAVSFNETNLCLFDPVQLKLEKRLSAIFKQFLKYMAAAAISFAPLR